MGPLVSQSSYIPPLPQMVRSLQSVRTVYVIVSPALLIFTAGKEVTNHAILLSMMTPYSNFPEVFVSFSLYHLGKYMAHTHLSSCLSSKNLNKYRRIKWAGTFLKIKSCRDCLQWIKIIYYVKTSHGFNFSLINCSLFLCTKEISFYNIHNLCLYKIVEA